ncbi:hypothetical protein SprV_1002801100 [Sparganum proliferum]
MHNVAGEGPTLWGSSVVTVTQGPSPPLRYVTSREPETQIDEMNVEIENGACYVHGVEVGKPCSKTKTADGFVTEIQLFSVTDHETLAVLGDILHTTLFVPNCVFPKPLEDEVIPQPSLPLTRFLQGLTEVTITFAASVGQDFPLIQLWDTGKRLCSWNASDDVHVNQGFCRLTSRNNNTELWFNGVFRKGSRQNNTYKWWINSKSLLSVSVDWTQTGRISLCQKVKTIRCDLT